MKWSRPDVEQLITYRTGCLSAAVTDVHGRLNPEAGGGISMLHSMMTAKGVAPAPIEVEIVATRAEAPTYINWGELDGSGRLIFRLPGQTVDKFVEVANQSETLGARRDFWHFDLFLIHELLHAYQGMERGRHRGLLNRAPSVLATLDYESDATAVATLFALALLDPERFFGRYTLLNSVEKGAGPQSLLISALSKLVGIVPYWGTLSRIVHAQLWHLGVFTAAMVDTSRPGQPAERSLEIASGRQFSLAKLERTFAWLLQYYRAVYFRSDGRLPELHLQRPPLVEFRNLRAAAGVRGQFLKVSWPDLEAKFVDETLRAERAAASLGTDASTPSAPLRPEEDDTIVVAVVGKHGMTRVARWNPSATGVYQGLFTALFTGRLEEAEPFFLEVFVANPWLIGLHDDPIRGSGPDPGAVSKLLDKKRRDRRSDFLVLDDPANVARLQAEFGGSVGAA
jgi:hypothetical protein